MHIRISAAILGVFALACAGDPSTRSEPPSSSVPDIYRDAVSQAEEIGLLIFQYDRAAWVATDSLFAQFPNARRRLRGWIVEPTSSGWLVYFVRLNGGRAVYAYRVELSQHFEANTVIEYATPEFLMPVHLERYSARRFALSSTTLLCSTNYNTVVLPAHVLGDSGWLVYLLAASTIPGEHYLGHHRVFVDDAGTTILRTENLSKTCLRTSPPPENAVGAGVTHLISETPIDIHVYRNLVTDMHLLVAAGGNMWSITEGQIAFHGPLE